MTSSPRMIQIHSFVDVHESVRSLARSRSLFLSLLSIWVKPDPFLMERNCTRMRQLGSEETERDEDAREKGRM